MKGFTIFLVLIFILFLSVSCSGNIATSIPIPTNTLSPTPSASATPVPPTATVVPPTPVPFNLEVSIERIPEIYTNSTTTETKSQYESIVGELPLEGQKWITGMGQFLEDNQLTDAEITLLQCMADKNGVTNLSVFSQPTIIDGVTPSEAKKYCATDVDSISTLLKDDIAALQSSGNLEDAKIFDPLILMANDGDYEILKGLVLIDNYGIPPQEKFKYNVPTYNTQLLVLGKILKNGVPAGYEVAAVAAGLDYGSLWTIADDNLRAMIPGYASNMINYQASTDAIIGQKGVTTWNAKNTSLEGQIALVWGATGNYFPLTKEEAARIGRNIKPFDSWSGYREVFSGRQMTPVDFEFVSITPEILAEMREFVISKNLIKNSPNNFSGNMFMFAMMDNLSYQESPVITNIDGLDIFNAYICNPKWEWQQYKSNGKFVGSSGDAYVQNFFLKSLNLAGITPTHYAHQSGFLDFDNGLWKDSNSELDVIRSWAKPIDPRIGWNQVPWNNFVITSHPGNWSGRVLFIEPQKYDPIWKTGIPSGYIFRADVSKTAFPDL
jgi:hypothetical protein